MRFRSFISAIFLSLVAIALTSPLRALAENRQAQRIRLTQTEQLNRLLLKLSSEQFSATELDAADTRRVRPIRFTGLIPRLGTARFFVTREWQSPAASDAGVFYLRGHYEQRRTKNRVGVFSLRAIQTDSGFELRLALKGESVYRNDEMLIDVDGVISSGRGVKILSIRRISEGAEEHTACGSDPIPHDSHLYKPESAVVENGNRNFATGSDVIRIRTISDKYFTAKKGGAVRSRIAALEAINTASTFFEQIGISLTVVEHLALTSETDSFGDELNATRFIDSITYGSRFFSSLSRVDLNHVFTSRNFDGAVAGVAWIGATCALNTNVSVSQYFEASHLLSGLIAAHEIGHSAGATHDNNQVDGKSTIMSTEIHTGISEFSPRSAEEIGSYLSRAQCDYAVALPGALTFEMLREELRSVLAQTKRGVSSNLQIENIEAFDGIQVSVSEALQTALLKGKQVK
ncbi:MAG: hypothetical protein KDD70_18225, partial [Bdellovibrionales bacterium]|nr:hypothetical protein [Bdellovibrionales bacterium]